jgi:hypothetical protein
MIKHERSQGNRRQLNAAGHFVGAPPSGHPLRRNPAAVDQQMKALAAESGHIQQFERDLERWFQPAILERGDGGGGDFCPFQFGMHLRQANKRSRCLHAFFYRDRARQSGCLVRCRRSISYPAETAGRG